VSTYTQSQATIDCKVGGEFSLFEGTIKGKFVELETDKKIVEKWRFNDWPDDHYSVVTIELSQPSTDVCRVVLNHRSIPLVDKYGNHSVPAKVLEGWNRFFWDRIEKILGFARVEL